MSQRRQKKQLDIMDNVNSLTDAELRDALKKYDQAPGPVTDSTRNLYRKKLASLIEEEDAKSPPASGEKLFEVDVGGDDDDDTSDEDYNVLDDEELEEDGDESEDEDSEDEDSEDEDSEEEDSEEDGEENVKSLSAASNNLTASVVTGTDVSTNRTSRTIPFLTSFFISLFVTLILSYLYLSSNYRLDLQLQPFKNITKQLLVLLALSPIAYAAYKTIRYYRLRRHQELQRVCDLVDEALELLQSPDNPKGCIPILHIRDTLLTPTERKSKKMINLWTKTVKFIEDHESRVKVELVNIDGEDFRAWKWIGSKKL